MLGRAPIVRIQTAPQKMIDANQGRANALTPVFRPAKGDRWAARRAGGEGGNRQNRRSPAFAPNPDPREFVRLALRAPPPVPGCRHSRSGGVELIGREIIPADEAQPSWVRLIVRDIQRGRMHRQRPEKQKSSSVLTKIAPDARSGGMIPARAMALGLDLRL
jgi:hypothetical protein